MAIWYWDPVGGNNANDGTTFANRKLNLQNLTLVAAGDTVRCIKSPDAVDTGQTATWTDGSNNVVLTSAVTQLITSCDTNWTAATNVTCATNTTRKEGTNSQLTTIAAAFTTGKAGYFATGTLNCAGYQQITFWMMQTSGTLAVSGDYTMSLCSDTLGATQVNNFAMPAITVLNQWFPVTIDLATNLGASIQSIAFYVNVDRGAVNFQFDQISVGLASASAGAITLNSLISKNNSQNEWLGIRSISGTTITLDSAPQYTLNLAGIEPLWSGTTENVELWRRETLKTLQSAANATVINDYAGATGSVGNIVTISGGWDTTNMSTQTGQTYLDGSNGFGYGLRIGANTSLAYMTISNINVVRYFYGIYHQSSNAAPYITITGDNFNNNANTGLYIPGNSKNLTLTVGNISKNGYSSTNGYGFQFIFATSSRFSILTITNLNSNWINGLTISGSTSAAFTGICNITNANRNSFDGVLVQSSVSATFNITNLLYNSSVNGANSSYGQISFITIGNTYGSGGLIASSVGNHDNIINLTNITNTANTSAGIVLGLAADNNKINITGGFSGFNSGTYNCIISPYGGTNYITSASAIFTTAQTWATVSGNAKLYISTADIIAPVTNGLTGANAQVIVKNAYGIQGQVSVSPSQWNLT